MNVPNALCDLIDPAAVAAKLAQFGVDVAHVTPDYVRHKPDDTTIISYQLTMRDGPADRGYVRWCTDTAEADHIEHKARTLRTTTSNLGVATIRLDKHTIFYPFPNDARLRRLRWHTTPRKWKRTLQPLFPRPMQLSGSRSSVEILRYKPERRVVVAAHLATTNNQHQSVLIRYTTSSQAATLAATAASLQRCGVDTPRPLMQLDDHHVSIDEFINAMDLRAAVTAGQARTTDVADAIAGFHSAPITATCRHISSELAQLDSSLRGLQRWSSSSAELADDLRRELARTVPSPTADDVLIHGDLHDRNMMIRPSGDIVFVDLERVAQGPAAIDLGHFRGAGIAAGFRHPEVPANAAEHAQGVVDDYRSRQHEPSSDHEIAWHTAVALTGQALLAARHLEPDWERNVTALLDLGVAQVASLQST